MVVKANHDISSGLETAFINSAINSNLAYRPEFVSNDYTQGKKVSVAIEFLHTWKNCCLNSIKWSEMWFCNMISAE